MDFNQTELEKKIVIHMDVDSLNADNHGEFKKIVSGFINRKKDVILDLKEVNFMDSSACGTILYFLRNLNKAGYDLAICEVTKPVQILFGIIKFNKIINIFDSLNEAIGEV